MPLRDDLLTPIAGENPSGANLRYDPVYDKIKEARRVEDEGPQGAWRGNASCADYRLVIKLAGDTLATRTKDLQLGAWLTEALLFQEGFRRLAAGTRPSARAVSEPSGIRCIRKSKTEIWNCARRRWSGSARGSTTRCASVPITRGGLNFYKYKESRAVGTKRTPHRASRSASRAKKPSPRESHQRRFRQRVRRDFHRPVPRLV